METTLIKICFGIGILLAFWLAFRRYSRRTEQRADPWVLEDARHRIVDDEDYITSILRPGDEGYAYNGWQRGDIAVRSHREPEPVTQAVEDYNSYATGRVVRLVRRYEEERTQWHWDTLTGTWRPAMDLIENLEPGDWFRELLLEAA